MCGLLGFATSGESKLSPELTVHVLNTLMQENDGRGGDSFGLAVVSPEDEYANTYKFVGPIRERVHSKPWNRALLDIMRISREEKPLIVMGHNRKATMGANTMRNAHPFQFGHIKKKNDSDVPWVIGAHNGMIRHPWKFHKHWEIKREIEVDSEVVFRGMQVEDPSKVIGFIRGANSSVALTYMYEDPNRVYLYRGNNPLSLSTGRNFVFWSSTEYALKRATFGLPCGIHELKDDTLLSLDVPKMLFRTEKAPAKSEPPFQLTSSYEDWRDNYSGHPFTDNRSYSVGSRYAYGYEGIDWGDEKADYEQEDVDYLGAAVLMHNTTLTKCETCDRKLPVWSMLWMEDYCHCPYCYYFLFMLDEEFKEVKALT